MTRFSGRAGLILRSSSQWRWSKNYGFRVTGDFLMADSKLYTKHCNSTELSRALDLYDGCTRSNRISAFPAQLAPAELPLGLPRAYSDSGGGGGGLQKMCGVQSLCRKNRSPFVGRVCSLTGHKIRAFVSEFSLTFLLCSIPELQPPQLQPRDDLSKRPRPLQRRSSSLNLLPLSRSVDVLLPPNVTP